jgi:DNA-binding PadR family transcriptional regulator
MSYSLKVLGLLYSDPKGKQLLELVLGFYPLQPNRQVLKNTLLILQRQGLIEVDPRLGRRHYIYRITDKGKTYFQKRYLPIRLIEETKIKPFHQEGDVT